MEYFSWAVIKTPKNDAVCTWGMFANQVFFRISNAKNQLRTCGRYLFARAEFLARSIGVARISGEIDFFVWNMMKVAIICAYGIHIIPLAAMKGLVSCISQKQKNSVMFSPWVTCLSHPPEKKTTARTFMNVWKGFCKVQGHLGTSNSQFFEWIDKNGDLQPCSM